MGHPQCPICGNHDRNDPRTGLNRFESDNDIMFCYLLTIFGSYVLKIKAKFTYKDVQKEKYRYPLSFYSIKKRTGIRIS